ncbi:MAG: adaptor protein MecA [Lachnospiraceae bacterium]|nr:adaptor protein MecA [Lachnospiraceae bacterium]
MEIKKLNNNCITCRISKQELDERGMVLEDLMSDKEKARELLHEVLVEAEHLVDFKVEGPSLNVQMAVLNDGDINLTIFDDDKSAFAAMLKQYKEVLEAKQKELMEMADEAKNKGQNPLIEVGSPISALSSEETKALLNEKEDDEPVDLPVEVSFDSIDDAIKLASLLFTWNGDTESNLYRYRGRLYLQFVVTETKLNLVRSVFAIAEFSSTIENSMGSSFKVSEHGECIIAGHALRDLASMALI